MTHKKQELFYHRSSSQQFLFCKSDSKPKHDKVVDAFGVESSKLSKMFPDILVGKNFVDHAMTKFNSTTKFEAMIVRIDDMNHKEKTKTATSLIPLVYM